MFSIKHNFQTEKDSININELAEIKSQETGQRELYTYQALVSQILYSVQAFKLPVRINYISKNWK